MDISPIVAGQASSSTEALLQIFFVMLISGAFGGLVNRFLDERSDETMVWWKHMVVGVGAAFMVPLFLNMISGDLLDKISGVNGLPGDKSKLFVLAGFCLVASVSSRAFIKNVSDRVLKDRMDTVYKKADDAINVAKAAKEVTDTLVETDAPEQISDDELSPQLDNDELAVLTSVVKSNFSVRSVNGISRDSRLDKDDVKDILNRLVEKKCIGRLTNNAGSTRYHATDIGRVAVRS